MKKKFKFGVIGAGFMSNAIVSGVIGNNYLDSNDIIVSDISKIALEKYEDKGVKTTLSNNEVFENAEYVLLAIKPQHFVDMANKLETKSAVKIISIMAGVKKAKIGQVIPNAIIARCMPNTPCSVGYGAVGIDLSDYTDVNDQEFIKGLFSSFAKIVLLGEDKLNAVTGISGSSPAYFYLFLKGIIEAGVKNGLSYEDAKNLATNTMIGSGIMALNNKDKTLDELVTAVCSKGGTTIEAVKVYNESGLDVITEKAVKACVERASELEKL